MHRILHYILGVSLLLAPLSWADDDHGKGKAKGKDKDNNVEEREDGRKATVFEAQLVRVADLALNFGPSYAPPGADTLRAGTVSVRTNRTIEIELEGAVPNTTYNVLFCRFYSSNVCVFLAPNSVQTNAQGNADAEFRFPDGLGNVLTGVFMINRNSNTMFVTGFQLPNAPVDLGVDIDLKGTISSINNTNQTFRLETFPVDITVNSTTKFSGLDRFADLRVGQTVEVEGIAAAGGVTASRIKLKD
jgi:uncharacterized protein DUF5666